MYGNYTLDKEYRAAAAITKFRVAKFDAADGDLVQAAAATDKLYAISQHTAASGDRVRARISGISEAEAGGNIAKGDLLTSDADGKVVAAAPAAGVNNRIIGIAVNSAVLGDIFPVLLNQGSLQGA